MADVFTSQPRSLQEYTRMVAAGGVEVLPCLGEFVFVTEALVEFRLVIGGKNFKLKQGDHIRVERFRDLELHNLSEENALTVTLIVGFGEFDRRIINGTVTMMPGVLRADGSYEADTRQELALYVSPSADLSALPTAGQIEIVKDLSGEVPSSNAVAWDEKNKLILVADGSSGLNNTRIVKYDQFGNYIETIQLPILKNGSDSYRLDTNKMGCANGYLYISTETNANSINNGSVWRCNVLMLKAASAWDRFFTPEGGNWPGGDKILYFGLSVQKETGNLVVGQSNGRIYEIDPGTGAVVRELVLPGSGSSRSFTLDALGNPVVVNGATPQDAWFMDWGSGLVRTLGITGITFDFAAYAMIIGGGLYIVAPKYSAGDYNLIRVQLQSGSPVLRGLSLPIRGDQCACLGRMLKRDHRALAQAIAAVSVISEDGVITVSGEAIKMALGFYSGAVPGDYLDHVFGIESSDVSLDSGQNSFLRMGIEDQFTLRLPGIVRLKVDKDLL